MSTGVLVFAICALVCVIAHVAILMSIIGRRSRAVDSGVPQPKLGVEIMKVAR